jgi:hypothetical protein
VRRAGLLGVPDPVGVPSCAERGRAVPSSGSDRRGPEAVAYPVVMFLAVYLVAYQVGDSLF